MKIVLMGAGETGCYVAQLLLEQGHDLVVVDRSEKAVRFAQEHLDAQVISGDGANALTLEPVVDEKTDLFIALTGSDKSNIIGSLIAKRFGAHRAVVRVSDPVNLIHPLMTDDPSIAVINAEMTVSKHLTRLVANPSVDDIEFFANGKAEMVKLHVGDQSEIAYRKLKEVKIPDSWLLVASIRGQEFSILSGESTLQPGDQVLAIGNPAKFNKVEQLLGLHPAKVKRVVLIGMNDISAKLAQTLNKRGIEVGLIESSKLLADRAAAQLDKVLVIQGDGTSDEILDQAGVDEADYLISLTGDDETNVLISLLAKERGCKRVVVMTEKAHYKPLIEKIGVDTVVTSRAAVVDELMRAIHREKLSGINVFESGEGTMMEYIIDHKTKVVGVPLGKLKLPKNSLVGAIVRDGDVIIPRGDSKIKLGDHIVVFAAPEALAQIQKLFAG